MKSGTGKRRHGRPQPAARGATPRLYERARDILRARIRDGQLPKDGLFLESHVAAEFGISRAPARRALAELADEGLLAPMSGRGYRSRVGAPAAKTPATAVPTPVRLSASASWEPIYGEVETEIAARLAFGGWRVIESDVARYHGVSRTVAREVLARLQQCGLVRKDERSRWIAPGLTRAYLGELYEMRRVLEPAALLAAAPYLPRAQIRALRENLEAAIARADMLTGADLDRLETELHVELLAHCPNATLLGALANYQSLLIAHSFLYRWGPRLFASEPFLPEHLEIAERLEGGHLRESAAALERHMRMSLDRAVARIDAVARGVKPPILPYLEPI